MPGRYATYSLTTTAMITLPDSTGSPPPRSALPPASRSRHCKQAYSPSTPAFRLLPSAATTPPERGFQAAETCEVQPTIGHYHPAVVSCGVNAAPRPHPARFAHLHFGRATSAVTPHAPGRGLPARLCHATPQAEPSPVAPIPNAVPERGLQAAETWPAPAPVKSPRHPFPQTARIEQPTMPVLPNPSTMFGNSCGLKAAPQAATPAPSQPDFLTP